MPYHAALFPCHLMLRRYHACLQVMADPDLAGMMTNPKVSQCSQLQRAIKLCGLAMAAQLLQ